MTFFIQTNPIGVIEKIVLALSNFIMAWAGVFVQLSKRSQIKLIFLKKESRIHRGCLEGESGFLGFPAEHRTASAFFFPG